MEDKKAIEFVDSLNESLNKELAVLDENYTDIIIHAKKVIPVLRTNILLLKQYIVKHNFKNSYDEINFFKNLKPKFISKLIYYHYIYNIESSKPIGYPLLLKQYYENELNKINEYYTNNREFYLYYKSANTYLDSFYFIRKQAAHFAFITCDEISPDPKFTTIYDYKLATIIAYEQITDYIMSFLMNLTGSKEETVHVNRQSDKQITWTASKVSLVELLYALQSAGSCNNGNIDLKNLAGVMEKVFNVDLGNYYRIFQEMRIRKINRTTYLDLLKNRLIQRMDETDENPRF